MEWMLALAISGETVRVHDGCNPAASAAWLRSFRAPVFFEPQAYPKACIAAASRI
jgi:hypothetical protein